METVETTINGEFTEPVVTMETVETITNGEEIELLTLLNDNLKTTNTLIMIIFIVAISVIIYNLMWKFIKTFI